AEHPEWQAGASEVDDVYYSIEHEAHSGALTTLLDLREAGELGVEQVEALPATLRPYATAPIEPSMTPRIKAMDSGTYYAREDLAHRFAPMQTEVVHDAVQVRTTGSPMPRITEGRGAGQFKEHWA